MAFPAWPLSLALSLSRNCLGIGQRMLKLERTMVIITVKAFIFMDEDAETWNEKALAQDKGQSWWQRQGQSLLFPTVPSPLLPFLTASLFFKALTGAYCNPERSPWPTLPKLSSHGGVVR